MSVSIPPTNTTPATAYDLNGHLPLDATVDITGLANPQKIWFKYTLDGVYNFAWSAYASGYVLTGGIGYNPEVEFRFNDPLSAPFRSDDSKNGAVEAFIEESIGVAKTGVIYISFHNGYGSGAVAPTPISVYIRISANTALPAGSIVINNDTPGDPMSILSPTGEPTQIRSFPSSERAAILENGISLWGDNSNNTKLHLFDKDLMLVTVVTWDRGGTLSPVSSDREHTFYAATKFLTPGKITTISDTGVLGSTEWTITNLTYTYVNYYHIAPSFLNDDILFISVSFTPYIAGYYGISKFHKSTGVVDPIFLDADDPGWNWDGFFGDEFLVLPNDSSLLMFRSLSFEGSKVKLFSSSGVFIRDFNIFNADVNHIAYHGDTYDSFWAWSFSYDNFESNFIHFRISDGEQLANFTVPTTSASTGFTDPADPYNNMWGVPECCPFITTTKPLPRYGPPPPVPPIPGIVVVVEGKRNDIDQAIPTPTFRTALLP